MKAVAAFCAAVVLCACTADKVTEFVADEHGHLQKVGKFTKEESFKRDIDREIGLEASGVKPPAGYKNWREYWLAPHWLAGSSDFGTEKQVLAYVRRERRARGLPPL